MLFLKRNNGVDTCNTTIISVLSLLSAITTNVAPQDNTGSPPDRFITGVRSRHKVYQVLFLYAGPPLLLLVGTIPLWNVASMWYT